MSRTSFGKREREKQQKARAAAKAERRAQRNAGDSEDAAPPVEIEDQAVLLDELADLHARYEAGDIDLDTLTASRDQLTRRLTVE
jgi:hypothetical protein